MLKIYHMPNSRSTRVIVAAEELRIPYQIDLRRRSELKRADLLAINPLGGAPAIEDGDVKMMESMAIVEYLLERYDTERRLTPAVGSPERPKYLQWLHFAEAMELVGPQNPVLHEILDVSAVERRLREP